MIQCETVKMEEKANVGNTSVEAESGSGATPAKKSPAKAKSTKTAKGSSKSHPPTSEMVNTAISELKERKGSSLQAIKKYIVSTYMVDGDKLAPFIKRYLKAAVTSGAVVQTKGKGASGSFKLPVAKNTEAKTKAKAAETKKTVKSVEKKTTTAHKTPAAKSPAKKAETTKKPAAKKSPAKTEKPAKSEKKSSNEPAKAAMSKSKKTAKAPAAKTKTPKPKKAAAAPSKAVKSAAKK